MEHDESQEPQESNEPRKGAPIDDKLAKELNEHHRALMEEFELVNKELSPDSQIADIREYWRNKVPNACAQIAWLAMNAHSEGIKLSANKYIIQEAYAETGDKNLEDILKSLKITAASN